MVDAELLDAVVAFLAKQFADYTVQDETGKLWPFTVVDGFIPPKRTDETEDYEKFCILVRYADGEADWVASDGRVNAVNRITVAVRTTSFDVKCGPRNTINTMAMIQRMLYRSPVLAKKYRATFPLEWKAPAGDTMPFWQGEMTIPFTVPAVQEEWED